MRRGRVGTNGGWRGGGKVDRRRRGARKGRILFLKGNENYQ